MSSITPAKDGRNLYRVVLAALLASRAKLVRLHIDPTAVVDMFCMVLSCVVLSVEVFLGGVSLWLHLFPSLGSFPSLE